MFQGSVQNPILAVDLLKKDDVKVFNMGVDYDKYDNEYWRKLEKEYEDNLVIIPFLQTKKIKIITGKM